MTKSIAVRVREGKRYMPANKKEQEPDMPIVACITVGDFQENCYLYACPHTREAVIIDPGDEPEKILQSIRELELLPKYILNTHGHIDHIGAIDAISIIYSVPLAIHPDDVPLYTDESVAKMYGRPSPLVHR